MVEYARMGQFFKKQRKNRKYTQLEESNFVDVCEKTIHNLESGETNTNFDTILAVCDLLEIDLSVLKEFYTRDPNMDYQIKLYNNSDKCKKKRAKARAASAK